MVPPAFFNDMAGILVKKNLILPTLFLISFVMLTAGRVPNGQAVPFVIDFSFSSPVTQASPVTFNPTASGNTGSLQYAWYLEDGTYLGGNSVLTYTFTSSGSRTLALRVYDSGTGATAYASHSVTIQPSPLRVDLSETTSQVLGQSGTVGSPVTFSGSASGGTPAYDFRWDFGDGATGVGVVATHTYSVSGFFVTVLRVTDADGFVAVASRPSSISTTPVRVDYPVPTQVIQNEPTTFTPSVTGNTGSLSFQWRVDGTYVSANSALSYAFPNSGNHTLTLIVYDSGSNTYAAASHSVNVHATPLATDFSFPTPVTQGSSVTFTAAGLYGASSGSISWSFGDAGTATGNPATHVYSTAGSFTARLTVTYANGTVANVQHTVNVAATPLRVDFSSATGPTQGSPVTFTATVLNGVPPFSYTWYFGDGASDGSNLNPISHTYLVTGNYTVMLVAYDSNPGGRVLGVVSHGVAVGLPRRSLEADFSIAAPATENSPVTFVATATFGIQPYGFNWNFGDGATGAGPQSTHSYSSTGLFNVVLKVTDSNGATATANHPLSVLSTSIQTDFSFATPITKGSPVAFVSTVSGATGTVSFVWRLGDGTPLGYGSTQGYTFASAGNYTVSLFITDGSAGGSAFASHSLTVKSSPVTANYMLSPYAGITVGSPATWTATTSGGNPPYSFSWDFGDGSTGTGVQTTHTYSSRGPFLLALRVTDSAGAVAVASGSTGAVPFSSLLTDFSFPTPVTQGSPVTFTPTLSGASGTLYYFWTLSDGTSLGYSYGATSIPPVSYTFNIPGTYSLTLYVVDPASGASAYASHGVSVRPNFPTTDFTFPAPVTQASPIAFTATGVAGASSIDWSFGDGGTGTGVYTTHTYSTAGTFTAVLTVRQANGAITTASHPVSVQQSSVHVDFSFPTTSQASLVAFNATVSGGVSPYQFYWYFGDGTSDTGNANPVSHTYTVAGNFTVSLNVYDSNPSGRAFAGASHRVNVALPKAALLVDLTGYTQTVFTVGSPRTLSATAVFGAPPYTFSWSFGDGGKGSGAQTTHTYSSPGTFIIIVNATDANNTVATASTWAVVVPTPILADFSFPSVSQGSPVTFNATASGGVTPYTIFYWYFGDGTTDFNNLNPIQHNYSAAGTYVVTLLVEDSSYPKNYSYASHLVNVSLPRGSLEADFSGFNGYTQGSPVTLFATVSFGTPPYTFSWDFGDHSSGTGNPVTHTFAAGGTYIVVLKVTDSNGAVATASHAGTIIPTPIRADFSLPSVSQGSPVTFNATITGGVAPYSQLYWYFGDGTTDYSNVNPIRHTYSVAGTYVATLLVRDSSYYNYSYVTHIVNVSLPRGSLKADFNDFNGYTQGSPVAFSAIGSFGTPPYSYSWDFGDHSSATGSPVSHSFATAGLFIVVLRVTDANGAVATTSRAGTIVPSPVLADFSISSNPTQGNPVTLTATSTGGVSPYRIYWYFGDGTSDSSGANPATKVYSLSGTYLVTLLVYDFNNIYAYATHVVTVSPSARITVDFSLPLYASVTAGSPGTWTATVSGGMPPYSFAWTFGDGGTALGSQATHTYTSSGSFNITLRVTDLSGTFGSTSRIVAITPSSILTNFSFLDSATTGSPVAFVPSASGNSGSLDYYWRLGDGTYLGSGTVTGILPAIGYTFGSPGNYTVSLFVRDESSGASAFASHSVTVKASPLTTIATFPIGAAVTIGDPATWTATTTGGNPPYVFSWDFGDGATGTGIQATHVYSSAGPFILALKTTDSDGAVAVASGWTGILPSSSLKIDFSFASPVTQGSHVAFVPSVSGNTGGLSFVWRLGDGSSFGSGYSMSNLSAAGYTFPSSGNYTVSLFVRDESGYASAFVSHSVTVKASPVRTIATFPTSTGVTIGSPGTWTGTASGGNPPYSFTWEFGDGTTGTGVEAAHTYSSRGPFLLVLKATDSDGAIAVASGWTGILPGSPLLVDFSSSPVTQGSPVTFTATVAGDISPYSYTWNFGDGTVDNSNSNPVSHTYANAGNYTASLVLYDSNPFSHVLATASHTIRVILPKAALEADFSPPPVTVGSPATFSAAGNFGAPPYLFSWSFGDGNTATGNPVTHTYSSLGFSTVALTVSDTSGTAATASHTIYAVATPLTADFTLPAASQGSPVTFTATVSGGVGPYRYTWYFGDGSSDNSNTNPVTHSYTTTGNYTVTMLVYDSNPGGNVYAYTSHWLKVGLPKSSVEADFSLASAYAGNPGVFRATASFGAPPYLFSWSFGDGNTATGNPVSHTYSNLGLSTVTLTVRDASGTIVTVSHTIGITATPIQVDFSLPTVSQGSPVGLLATPIGGIAPYYFTWYFGDGVVDNTNLNPISHTYISAGNYTITLVVHDSNPDSVVYAVVSHSVRVSLTRLALEGDFSSPTIARGSPATFAAQALFGAPPYSFSWDFGDGGTGTGSLSTHTYSSPGSYTVILTLSDRGGGVATVSHVVTVVSTPLVGDFTFPGPGSQGSPVTFTATISGGVSPYTFYWYFGDGLSDTSNVNPVSHTYSSGGKFTVSLVVYDSNSTGRAYTVASHSLTILPVPAVTADFSFPTPTIFGYQSYTGGNGIGVGEPVTLTAVASGGTVPYTFSWAFGDGSAGTEVQATHSYNSAGTFTVVLTVMDNTGAVVTASHALTVVSVPVHVDFTFPTPVAQGTGIGFNATVTGATGTVYYDWRLGDGSQFAYCAGCSFVGHTFATPGNYTVALLVYDSSGTGAVSVVSHAVRVLATPMRLLSVNSPTLGQFYWGPYGNGGDIEPGEAVTWTAVVSGGTAPYSFSWDFGDSSAGSGSQTTHTYSSTGAFMVVLRVTDANGNIATTNGLLRVASVPVHVDFTFPTPVAQGTGIGFNATVTGATGTVYYDWRLGDGSQFAYCAGCSFVGHTFATPGNYTVTLVVYDSSGTNTAAIVSHSVGVLATPVRIASATAPTLAQIGYSNYGNGGDMGVGEPIVWTGVASGGTPPYTFSWDFGDGSSGTGFQVTHTYSSPGLFMVVLRVTDSNGNVATTNGPLKVASVPVHVDFTFPTPVTQGTGIGFNATVTGATGTVYYDWRLADNTQLTGCNSCAFAGHTFTTPGNYTVFLIVYDSSGTGVAAIVSHVVSVSASPVRIISVGGPIGFGNAITVGSPWTLTAAASGGTPSYTFSWTFGDGSTGAGFQVTHTYSSAGVFTVVLRVRDADGFVATTNFLMNVGEVPAQPDFTFPTPVTMQTPVTFTASVAGGTPPYTYSWDFGDGMTGTGNPVTHTYATLGFYTVTLTVTDTNGLRGSVSHTVGVSILQADYTFDPPSPTSGQRETFTAVATGGIGPYTYSWDFGDGTTGTGNPVTHIYNVTVATAFTVTLTVTDSTAKTISPTHTITVYPITLALTVTCGSATAAKPVTCTATATGGTGGYSFSWSAPAGSPSTGSGTSFTTTFATKGIQTVTATATDTGGNTGTGSASVTIAAQPLQITVTCASATAGKPVTCNASATGGTEPYTFTWSSNGTPATGGGISYTTIFAVKGMHSITATVHDANGISQAGTASVSVTPQSFVPDFTFTPLAPTSGQSITFTASAAGGTAPFTFTWDFGDSTTGTGSSVNHSYTVTSATTLHVGLTATDANGVVRTVTHDVTVSVTAISVEVTCSPATAGKPVTCNASTTNGVLPIIFSWSAPSGSPPTGSGASFTTTFASKGVFLITASGTDADGSTGSGSVQVTVAAQSISVIVTCGSATAGKPVTCSAAATGGTSPYVFRWSSSGSPASGMGSTYTTTFATKGSRTVTVTATDANILFQQGTATLTVAPQPLSPDFTFIPAVPASGQQVTFTASAIGGTSPYTFAWDFGDSTTGAGSPTTHTFTVTASTTFHVSLTATDANGVSATMTRDATVSPVAIAVTVSCGSATVGKTVTCTATANGGSGPFTFSWSAPNGSPSTGTGASFVTAYSVKGSNLITTTATDSNGASGSGSTSIVVSGQPLQVIVSCGDATAGNPLDCSVSLTGGTSPYTITWTAASGNPSTGAGTSFTTTFATKGGYTISANARDSNGAIETGSAAIQVAAQPLAGDFSSTSATSGKQVEFDATASGGTAPYTFNWSFGDSTGPASRSLTLVGTVAGWNSTSSANPTITVRQGDSIIVALSSGDGVSHQFFIDVDGNGPVPNCSPGPDKCSSIIPPSTSFTTNVNFVPGTYNYYCAFHPSTMHGSLIVQAGSVSTGSQVFHTYSVKGSYPIVLTINDANGVTATVSHTVTISPQPVTVIITTPSAISSGKPSSFSATITGGTGPYSVSWDFGDSSQPTTRSGVSHVYASKGSYEVSATVTDANGVSQHATTSVVVTAQPLAVTVTCPTSGITAGKPFSCTVSASGDTPPYTGTGPFSVTEPTKGTKTEAFSVTSANHVTVSGSATVTVEAQPLVVTVTCPTAGLTAGKAFNCSVSATGGTAPYTGTGTKTVTRSSKGTFTESFTVADSNGVTSSGSATVDVASQPFVITVTCPVNVEIGVAFHCSISASGGTGPYSGTGTFTITENTKGVKTETFSVTDANGATASGSATVAASPQPLTTSFTTSNNPTGGTPVTFTATVSGGTGPYSFSWDFGDGTTGTGNPVDHTYPSTGQTHFSITLTVVDANGAHAVSSQPITVRVNTLTASFTESTSTAPTGTSISFDASGSISSGTITGYSWNFGDGITGSGVTTSHAYSLAGGYTVTLTVSDSNGLTASAISLKVVTDRPPTAAFTFSPTGPVSGQTVSFDASSSSDPDGTVVSYAWNFGDGTTGSGSTTSHVYASSGTFAITLVVTDNNGSSGTATASIMITPASFAGARASLSKWSAAPSLHHEFLSENPTNAFSAYGVNNGNRTVWVYVRFHLVSDIGSTSNIYTQVVRLSQGQAINGKTDSRFSAVFTPRITGSFSVVATIFYSASSLAPPIGDLSFHPDIASSKSFSFTVVQ